jgi:hypothetical protein
MKAGGITPKIIDLSMEIAEKWRMEIYKGCWILRKFHRFSMNRQGETIEETWKPILIFDKQYERDTDIPIPSLSDALEKIRQLVPGELLVDLQIPHTGKHALCLYALEEDHAEKVNLGNTSYEAVLTALLEVLKVVESPDSERGEEGE